MPAAAGGLPEQLKALVDQLVAEQELQLRALAAENERLRGQLTHTAPAPQGVPGVIVVAEEEDSDNDSAPQSLPSINTQRFAPAVQTVRDSMEPTKAGSMMTDDSMTKADSMESDEDSPSAGAGWWQVRRRSTRTWTWANRLMSRAKDVEQDLAELRQEEEGEQERQNRLATEYRDVRVAKTEGMRGLLLKKQLSVIPTGQISTCRQKVLDLISWWLFDALLGFVIVANSVTIGVETSYSVHGVGVPPFCKVLENLFLLTYVMELGLRIYGYGLQAFKSHWVKFDAFLVASGILDLIVQATYQGTSGSLLDQVMLVRMLRLCRLIRAVRLVVQFRTLYLLVQGLLASTVPMFWVFVIAIFVVYVFAIFGMELHNVEGNFGEDYEVIAAANFHSIGDAMMMLLQFIMMDSVGGIYRPLIKARPFLSIFFVSFILLGSISLMNLVTAITVESALRQASEDQEAQKAWEEMKRKELIPKLKELFETLDTSGDGEIQIEEIKQAPDEVKEQLLRICNMDDLEETYQMLDYDNSGGLDIEEFCAGIMRARADKPIELLRILKQCSDILKLCRALATASGVPM